jgi:hypothetical protein
MTARKSRSCSSDSKMTVSAISMLYGLCICFPSTMNKKPSLVWRLRRLDTEIFLAFPLLPKVANHAVLCNIGPVGQIHLPGNIMRHRDSGFKLSIVNKRSAVNPYLHAADRML